MVSGKKIKVRAYSAYRGEEEPRSFNIGNDRIDVLSIIESWLEEEKEKQGIRKFFKVEGSDGYVHTIFYDEASREWFLV